MTVPYQKIIRWIEHVLAYCRDWKKYIALLFKLYRATCRYSSKKREKNGCLWDLIPGPLDLQSYALPTELRGLWLQVNSWKLYLYLGWHGVTWHVKLTNENCCMPKMEHIKLNI